MKMMRVTLLWMKAWKQKRQEISKERLRRAVTRKFRAEIVELNLRTKCNRGQDNAHKSLHKTTNKTEKRNQPWKKNEHFAKKTERERRISATGVLETSHGFRVSLRVDTAPCWKGFADAASNVVRCWKKQKD